MGGKSTANDKNSSLRQSLLIQRAWIKGAAVWKVWRQDQIEIHREKFLKIQGSEIRHNGKIIPNQIFLAGYEKQNLQNPQAFDVIAILALESYLVGVLSSEMPLSWPVETLKAQAIAARSYAMATIQERSQRTFHLESSVLDQVFNHVHLQDRQSPLMAKAREAVDQTQGLILVNAQNKVLKAFYHSDCGGKTASPRNVWGQGTDSGVVTDDYCLNNPKASHTSWSLQINETELSRKIKKFLKRPELSLVKMISLIRPSSNERVSQIEILFRGGEKISMLADQLRRALGYDQLKSTLFSISRRHDQFQMVGQGFGHGVGLCQWGSRIMGMQGRTFAEILEHYYPRAQIRDPRRLLAGSDLEVRKNANYK